MNDNQDHTYSNTHTDTDVGYLRVRVTAGDLPAEGANVTVTEYPEGEGGGELLYSLRTDENGLTPPLALFAPPADESLTPGFLQPYSVYNVSVELDGYYPVEGVGVPVFENITAIQPFRLLPILEGEHYERVMIYETPDSVSLRPGNDREDIGNSNGTLTGGVRSGGEA